MLKRCFLLAAILLIASAALPQQHKPAKPAKPTPDQWVAATLKSMTLDEKIGQMIMPQMEGAFTNFGSQEFLYQLARVKQLGVGGFIVSRGTPVDTAAMLNELQKNARVPLLIAGDLERGAASQFPGYAVSLPSNLGIGATGNPSFAAFAGTVTATEARSVGYHMTFAPVADVNNNPDNPIINTRSFGEDPESVSKMVAAYVSAARSNGLIATAKHFPGHGDTATDSHIDLGVVTGDRERLDRVELAPFRAAIQAGVGAIMTAHLAVPAIEPDTALPATMSKNVLTGLLREQLGFRGLIVTDALDMGALTAHYWDGEIAVRAVQAGADILLMPPDAMLAIRVIRDAVKKGRIDESRIDESVERILRAKAGLGLHENRFVDLAKVGNLFGQPSLQQTAETIANASITLVRDTRNFLPLDVTKRRHVALVIVNGNDQPVGANLVAEFQKRLEARDLDVSGVGVRTPPEQMAPVVDKAGQADLIVAGVYASVAARKGTAGLPPALIDFIEKLAARNKPMMILNFGNPYLLRDFPSTPGYLCAFSAAEVSERAATRALFGEIPASRAPNARLVAAVAGKLPITIPSAVASDAPLAARGFSEPIPYLPMRLEMAHADQDKRFAKAFSIIEKAHEAHGFPGAVLTVGYKGKIVAMRAFGALDYSPDSPIVKLDTMFDMASCTKVVVTTTLAAMMIEQKMLNLDMTVRSYLPEFGTKDPADPKNKITVRQLMLHDSGLPAFKQYFLTSKNRAEIMQKIYETPLEYAPGTKSIYSDFGFILLGEILQRLGGYPLDVMATSRIFEPLGMVDAMFNPPAKLLPRIAPTENDKEFRKKVVRGEVHDENAWVMGGVSGHAGLFASADDLAIFAQMLLNGGIYAQTRYLRRSTVEMITSRQDTPPGSTRALGWDTPNPDGHSSAGHFLSPHAFGHTGFTGTSIWIDPDKELFIILLSNRVHPTREVNAMIQVRPAVADAVVEALGLAKP